MRGIETAPHELTGNLIYTEWGLKPYFACNAVIKQGGGKQTDEFRSDGERWISQITYRNDSNIIHPGEQTPTGAEWQLQPDTSTEKPTIKKEYMLKVARHPDEDEHEEQGFKAHIAPRWQGMEGLTNDGSTSQISVPDEISEAVNIKVQGSNVEFERYPELIRDAMDAIDINRRYVGDYHHLSNIQDAERYVRLKRDKSGSVHARDGPIANLGHLLENDRDGYRKVVQNDQDERGEQVPGYYHTVTLGPKRIDKAWPGHQLPKEIKHYMSREGANLPESHPLAHPKVGASYQVSRTEHDFTLYFDDLDQMNEELEETVHSVLMDADIDLNPIDGSNPYVDQDAYFDAEIGEIKTPTRLSLSQIESEQENVVVKHLADGLSPVQWESLETLVTDGGQVSPADIAAESERHVESVRRALREMDDLVETGYNEVAIRSEYVAEVVHQAIRDAEEATKRAMETVGQALEDSKRQVEENISAWRAWARRHGIEYSDEDGEQMEFDMGEIESKNELKKLLRQGEKLWKEMEQSTEEYRQAQVNWKREVNGRLRPNSLDVWQVMTNR